jgi:hypothetical protein
VLVAKLTNRWAFLSVVGTLMLVMALSLIVASAGSVTRGTKLSRRGTCSRTTSRATFAGSLGINVHMGYLETGYADPGEVEARLTELGIKHVRDGIANAASSTEFRSLRTLAGAGIGITMIVGRPGDDASQLVEFLRHSLGCSVEAVEGPNEYNDSGDPNWRTNLLAYQGELAATVRASYLRNRPVLAPSLTTFDAAQELGDIASLADTANFHPYPAGLPPEDYGLAKLEAQAHINVPRSPLEATETGYQNAINETHGPPAVPESVSAIYIPRIALEDYRRGIARTFFYELLDQAPDPGMSLPGDSFGLLRANFEPKPAFISLRNLIHAIGPSATRATRAAAQSLHLQITPSSDELRSLLLAAPGGRRILAIWRAVSIWSTTAKQSLTPPPATITIAFRGLHRVVVNRPCLTPAGILSASSTRSVHITLGADPVLLQLTPDHARGE